jgi:chromosome segregation ATPase
MKTAEEFYRLVDVSFQEGKPKAKVKNNRDNPAKAPMGEQNNEAARLEQEQTAKAEGNGDSSKAEFETLRSKVCAFEDTYQQIGKDINNELQAIKEKLTQLEDRLTALGNSPKDTTSSKVVQLEETLNRITKSVADLCHRVSFLEGTKQEVGGGHDDAKTEPNKHPDEEDGILYFLFR